MTANALLSRLEKVKQVGPGRWMARCPAHDDRSPSLSIRELNDGRVLINDHGGCGAAEILASVDLEFDALFPPRPIEHAKGIRRPVFREDVFKIIQHELAIIDTGPAGRRSPLCRRLKTL